MTVHTIGYARVSTREQNADSQESELLAAGADRVFVDRGESSRVADRPQWRACLDYLRTGDTLVIRALDRIAGSEVMAIRAISELHDRGVNIRSLTEPEIDTTTSVGRALFGIVAVFAQLRVDTIRENTRRGLAHARAQGRVGGRPTVMTPERTREAVRMQRRGISHAKIATILGVGTSSVTRALQRADRQHSGSNTAEPDRRVFYRDIKPYLIPERWEDLHGPVGGMLELPHDVLWLADRAVDLDQHGDRRLAYKAALEQGTAQQQGEILNPDLLIELWAELALPDRVRILWEKRFPQLRERVTA